MIMIITGPSGSGKTTLRRILNDEHNIPTLQNVTTRNRRANEKEGVDYLFITVEEFLQMRDEGHLLEWVKYSGNYYGLIGNKGENIRGTTVLETEGAKRLKAMFPDAARIIYLEVPEQVRRKRMLERGDSPCEADRRIQCDRERFENTMFKDQADLVVDNVDIDNAINEILSFLRIEYDG